MCIRDSTHTHTHTHTFYHYLVQEIMLFMNPKHILLPVNGLMYGSNCGFFYEHDSYFSDRLSTRFLTVKHILTF